MIAAECYALVRNIPTCLRSSDLRHFFDHAIQKNLFSCFHYRHRPEIQTGSSSPATTAPLQSNASATCCCIVRFRSTDDRDEFIRNYCGSNWTETDTERRCIVTAIRIATDEDSGECSTSSVVREAELQSFIELQPPSVYPQGNVGTPDEVFMDLIRKCILPSRAIKALNLTFDSIKRARRKPYSRVPPPGSGPNILGERSTTDEVQRHAEVHDPTVIKQHALGSRDEGTKLRDGNDDDANEEEQEWDRHCALHEDVTSQERLKPRLYEQEEEVTWEKGGPGLVFYTDDFAWQQREGTDTDALWADDWDVDMQMYEDVDTASTSSPRNIGDKDSMDCLQIRREHMQAQGKHTEPSVFRSAQAKELQTQDREFRHRSHKTPRDWNSRPGSELAHRLMRKQGWSAGEGLGPSGRKGKPYPLSDELDGQSGRNKRGLGYRGEKMNRFGIAKRPESTPVITTMYDDHEATDPVEPLMESQELDILKYRQKR